MTWARDQIRAKASRRRGCSERPARGLLYQRALSSRAAIPINEAMESLGKGTFLKKQILTREQARFVIYCLAYDRIKQKARGSRYHSYGLLTKLAKTFGVTRECIVQIDLRRI
jgi:hypothetical protein